MVTEIKFSIPALNFAFRMLLNPASLAPDQPYKAPDEIGAKDLIGLQRWFKSKEKMAWITEVETEKGKIQQWNFKETTVGLKPRYVDRLKAMCEHHKNVGRLTQNVEAYEELIAALNCKPLEIESVEE